MSIVFPFANDTAFAHLRDEGHVYTFRKNRRAEPNGDVWINRGRGTEGVLKDHDWTCEEVESRVPPTADVLDEYAAESGFGTAENWRSAINEVNDGLPAGGFIYRVERDERERQEGPAP
jgi:hypothetical protein